VVLQAQAVAAAVARALRGVTRTREQRQVWSSRHRPWPLQLRGHCARRHAGPANALAHAQLPRHAQVRLCR
jgi:hypothetical protein